MPPSPDDTRAFRAEWKRENLSPRYHGWLHLAFTSTWALAAIALSISRVRDVQPIEWLILPVGFLVANLAEYLGHKGPMHHRRAGVSILHARHTLQHHRYFTDEAMEGDDHLDFKMTLFPPSVILFFLGGLAAPIAAALYFLVSPNTGWLFAALAVSYFLTYEWLHLSYHLPKRSLVARLPVVQALRRHHVRHHDPRRMQRGNFNITFPIGDALFGTVLRDEERVDEAGPS